MSVKLPSHLHRNRHGVFYFRRAVPPDLRGYFPCKEIYRSLKTANKNEAYSFVRYLSAQVEFSFTPLRRLMPNKDDELKIELITEIDFDELGLPSLRVTREPHDTLEDYNAAVAGAMKALGQLPLPGNAKASVPPKTGPKLSELIERYIDEQRRGGLRKESVLDYQGGLGQFVVIIGDLPISELSHEVMNECKGSSCACPPT